MLYPLNQLHIDSNAIAFYVNSNVLTKKKRLNTSDNFL
jgi:hypothetical protein